MGSAHHNRDTSLTKPIGDFIGSRGVNDHPGHADEIHVLIKINGLDIFVRDLTSMSEGVRAARVVSVSGQTRCA